MMAYYITRDRIAEFQAKGWTVQRFTIHHTRYYLAWIDD